MEKMKDGAYRRNPNFTGYWLAFPENNNHCCYLIRTGPGSMGSKRWTNIMGFKREGCCLEPRSRKWSRCGHCKSRSKTKCNHCKKCKGVYKNPENAAWVNTGECEELNDLVKK